jgi:tRNA dimethylallyltransferase
MTLRGFSKENKPAIIICGPTGSGKSAVGMQLAEKYGGRIIGADSRQIYRQLNIGTAKPTQEDQARIKHYMIDIIDIFQDFSAKQYIKMASEAITETLVEGAIPFIVGGAGLYLEALTIGLFEGPDKDEYIRQELEDIVSRDGPGKLYDELSTIDPQSASRISPSDSVRIIRAIEIYRLTGRTLSYYQSEGNYLPFQADYLWIGITYDRTKLYKLIDDRVDRMISEGLIDEVDGLLRSGAGNPIIRKGIVGYCEVIEALEGKITIPEAIALIKQHSRNYAKRQLTWFRNKAPVQWLSPDRTEYYAKLFQAIDNHLFKKA